MIQKFVGSEKKKNLIILIITVLVLAIPILMRFIDKDPLIIGTEPYYHLRTAEQIINKNIKYDPLSYTGREYIFDPYDYFLFYLDKIGGKNLITFTPLFLGICCLVLFSFILKKLRLNLMKEFLVLLTFVLSPIFMYTFTVPNEHAVVIFLALLGILFFASNSIFLITVSIIIFGIVAFFNQIATLLIILLMLCYSLYDRKKRKFFYILLGVLLSIAVTYNIIIYVVYGFPKAISFTSVNYLQELLSDLGSYTGLSFFTIILSLTGLVSTWKHKKKIWLIYLIILMLLISLNYFSYSTIYLGFIIAVFTGVGFYKIISMRWKLKFVRDLSIFIIILGLIFSVTSYTHRLKNSLPDKNIKESLEWLDDYADVEDVILSHYSRGFWIEYFGKKAVVMDSLFEYEPYIYDRYRDVNAIFYGATLKDAKDMLNRYEIKYIYIDPEMKKGLVWNKEKQGLLFLFRNNESFKNVYNENGIEIWEYKKE